MTQQHFSLAPDGASNFPGYFPGTEATGPGLIVLQEIYGVNEEVRRVTDFYAQHNFRSLAPDLLWRVEPGLTFDYEARNAARDAIATLDEAHIVADILQAADSLHARLGGTGKIGILAFGWGGQHALAAARGSRFSAVVNYYPGNLTKHVPTAQAVDAAMQFHFSSHDTRTPPALRTAFRSGLAERDDVEIYTYAEPDHGFANRGRREYHETAARLADARTLDFFSRTLGA